MDKLKNKEIIELFNALNGLVERELLAVLGFAIQRNIRLLDPTVQDIDTAVRTCRDKHLQEHGQPTAELYNDIDKILNEESEVQLHMADINLFPNIPVNVLYHLNPILQG